jgi:hypothetical protein
MILSLGFAAACVLAAALAWWKVPRLRAWPPSLGLMIAVCTVVPPHQTAALGVGADDLLFVLGLALLVPHAIKGGRLDSVPYGRLLLWGAGLLAAGTTISAFVNAETLPDTLGLLVRGPGRVLLYVAAVLVVVAQLPRERTRYVVARGLVAVGVLEAVVSLAAYVVGLPGGFGLEEARGNTSLLGEIPGRVNGTLELSPNFLGALFTLTIPVTLGIALDAKGRRRRVLWGLAVLSQLAALVLTYTRASMAVTVVACVALLVLRGRLAIPGSRRGRVLWLAGGAVVIAGLLLATPVLSRLINDGTDRMALYASALKVFGAHPLVGVGPGEQAAFTAADPGRFRATSFGVAGNNAHNTVLLAAAENGILGLVGALLLNVAFVLVSITLLWRARRTWNGLAEPLGIGMAVLAFLIQGMTNNLFTVTLTATALVLLVGGCALPWLTPPKGTTPSNSPEARHALPASKEI